MQIKPKRTKKAKISDIKQQRQQFFVPTETSKKGQNPLFANWCFLFCSKSFRKKKTGLKLSR